MIRRAIAQTLLKIIAGGRLRAPDQIIGPVDAPYMHRWYLIPRNPVFNVYFHRFWRSDDDRALHDHPWWNASFLLDGSYIEHTISAGGVNRRVRRVAGDVKLRTAGRAHRLELDCDCCTTLFLTGPRLRVWGFHCPKRWVPWQEFTSEDGNVSTVGRGCGEP